MDIAAPPPVSALIPISSGQVRLNKPLPWPVYDAQGTLLLNQGFVVTSSNQMQRLLARGMFHTRVTVEEPPTATQPAAASAPAPLINPFAEYGALLEKLEIVLDLVARQQPNAERQVLGLARIIDRMCSSDTDACLALIYIYSVQPSAYEQTLFHCILCNLLARQLAVDPPRLIALMAASLTANIAVLRHQDRLNNLRTELTREQRAAINRHPELSAQAIRDCGVSNALWIQIIEQHHERGAGHGYPRGLLEPQIVPEALMLSLAERYTAMITQRAYRDRFNPTHAMQVLQEDSRISVGEMVLARELVRLLTANPPGCFVRLQNNEVAVVTRRHSLGEYPEVWAVTNTSGNPCLSALLRDTRNEDLRPVEQVEPLHLEWLNIPALWGYEG